VERSEVKRKPKEEARRDLRVRKQGRFIAKQILAGLRKGGAQGAREGGEVCAGEKFHKNDNNRKFYREGTGEKNCLYKYNLSLTPAASEG